MKIASNAVMSVASTLRSGLLAGILVVFVFASCDMMEPPVPPTAKVIVDQARITELGSATLISRSSPAPETTIMSHLWEQIDNGPRATVDDATADVTRFKAPFVHEMLDLEFRLTVTGSNGATASSTVTVTVSPSPNVDADGDGLIEIDTLAMLHNMRYNLAGTSYDTDDDDSSGNAGSATGDTGLTAGCPSSTCIGYELTRSLDFDTDGNGTWSGDNASGFMLDPNDSRSPYFVVEADGTGGWHPIGTGDALITFHAIFEGNGYTISNLAIRRDVDTIGFFGLFGVANDGSALRVAIRNIGLINNLADYTGNSATGAEVGGLVASHQASGSVIASYATGIASASASAADGVIVGGLIGILNGTVIGSYAIGNAYGSNGLVSDTVGGLVGSHRGAIIASYATGSVDGGGGALDFVGGLAGNQSVGSIVASYATGNVSGGADNNDRGGKLVGQKGNSTTITDSYAFGNLSEAETPNTEGDPGSLTAATLSATATSAGGAGVTWDAAASNTAGAWDFGTTSQAPVLRYADYDGPDGDVYSCDMFLAGKCGTIIPGQGR